MKLDVEYFRNPKVLLLPPRSLLVHLAGICYCGAYLTDGIIPDEALANVLLDARAKRRDVPPLIDHGLWYRLPRAYEVHDYAAMQDSRAKVEAKRQATAERVARWREKQARFDLNGDM